VDQVREVLAGVRPGLIDGTLVSAQKHAAGAGALQDAAFVLAQHRVVAQKLRTGHTEKPDQFVDIATGDPGGRDAAAVGASQTIDLALDFFGDALEASFDEGVPLEMFSSSFLSPKRRIWTRSVNMYFAAAGSFGDAVSSGGPAFPRKALWIFQTGTPGRSRGQPFNEHGANLPDSTLRRADHGLAVLAAEGLLELGHIRHDAFYAIFPG
jgi:hypothetical protein